MVKKMAGRTRSGLTLGTSISASIRLFCVVKARFSYVVETVKGLDVTLDDLAGLRRWILMDG